MIAPRLRMRHGTLGSSQRAWTAHCSLEQLEDRRLLSINWNGGGDGHSWGDPINWVGHQVPGILDDAVINVGGSPTIIFSTGSTTVHSLTSANNFSITGGSFTVNANSSVSGAFTMSGGSLTASGSGISFSASSTTTVSEATLAADSGATLSLPNLTSYTDSTGSQSITATGTGSQLSLAGLTNLSTSGNSFIVVQAQAGGHVSFAALTQITTSPIQLISSGAGSQLNLPLLATLHGTIGNNQSLVSLAANGTFTHGTITTLDRVDITLDGSTTSLSFPALTSITNSNITAQNGGILTLSAVTSYTDSATNYFRN